MNASADRAAMVAAAMETVTEPLARAFDLETAETLRRQGVSEELPGYRWEITVEGARLDLHVQAETPGGTLRHAYLRRELVR